MEEQYLDAGQTKSDMMIMKLGKCMPTPPKRVGRDFVEKYYTIMNLSPENLHCFYTESASFMHDDIDPVQRRSIAADCKKAIRDVMLERVQKYKHTKTKVSTVDTFETLDDGLIVQVIGEISYNEQPMRPFSQTIILVPKSPFHYFVQNDIFRFCDFDSESEDGQSDAITTQPMSMQEDWGTQCEIEERLAEMHSEPRVDCTSNDDGEAQENEVKLDTSDSGLSSDAEKANLDIQSLNLKNILQEPRNITKDTVKRGPTPPTFVEAEIPAEPEPTLSENELSANQSQLFRDSCVLTIGNVINPNIEFDDGKRDEMATSENEKTQDSVEKLNASKNDENNSNKGRYKKRKDKRKSKGDISKEKSPDVSNKEPKSVEMPTETDVQPVMMSEMASPGNATEKSEDKPEPPKPIELETPRAAEKISYADLAKSGKDEWIDELAGRRESMTDKNKPRSTMPRRSSRSEKTSPPHNNDGNRNSPKNNDLLQVFIGNIPHSANEDDIRRMFSRFGRLVRVRLHANTRKPFLPRYAFISYDSIQSVRQCLMKKHTFYWPENGPDGQKLNVNGDPSVDVWDDSGNRKPNDLYAKTRELRQFSQNFILNSKEPINKRSPESDTNISDNMKSERGERRKGSTRA